MSDPWDLRVGAGTWDLCRGDLSHRMPFVYRGIFAHCLRLDVCETVKGGKKMKVVIWKSPKALRGILKRLFKMEE